MNMLEDARKEINTIDKQMAELFVQRMRAVEKVSDYKKIHGLPVLDKEREEKIIAVNSSYVEDNVLREYYIDFFKDVMNFSKKYQERLQKGIKIAYSGVEGAFAEIAAKRIFPEGRRVPYGDFKSAYQAVQDGDCDIAVLPVENSYAGEVGGVIDLLFSGSLYVNGIYRLGIVQNLLGVRGARLSDIKTVISHPQALSQCGEYIKEHGFSIVEASNTAVAGKAVATNGDKTVAAIASVDTAKLYDLDVIDHDINRSNVNTTRFAVVSKVKLSDLSNKNSILMFTVSNSAGSLAKALEIIGKHKYNMSALRSRPMKSKSWQYYFYVELSGNVETAEGEKMLEELKTVCSELKILGTFSDESEI